MDIETLRTYVVLSDTRNYTRTSEQLFISQSTVTNRISELEKQVGARLFERTNRSVKLTGEGEKFLIYAKKVIELTESSLGEIASAKKYENIIRIGSTDSIYEAYLAHSIQVYKKKHKKDALKISIGMSGHLIEQLLNDYFDVVFTYLPLNRLNYECSVFRQDRIVLVTDVCNTKYSEGMTRDELSRQNYLMCNYALSDVGSFVRELFPRFTQFSLEIDDCSKVIPFLLEQDNYTFLPGEMAQPYVRKHLLRIIPMLDIETPTINSYVIGRKDKVDFVNKLL